MHWIHDGRNTQNLSSPPEFMSVNNKVSFRTRPFHITDGLSLYCFICYRLDAASPCSGCDSHCECNALDTTDATLQNLSSPRNLCLSTTRCERGHALFTLLTDSVCALSVTDWMQHRLAVDVTHIVSAMHWIRQILTTLPRICRHLRLSSVNDKVSFPAHARFTYQSRLSLYCLICYRLDAASPYCSGCDSHCGVCIEYDGRNALPKNLSSPRNLCVRQRQGGFQGA
jgi:hypothetical protein